MRCNAAEPEVKVHLRTADSLVLAAVCACLLGSCEPLDDGFGNGVGCVFLNEMVRLREAD